MKQTASFISTYAADVSGVCSALYELGGMTVMHDASGCNSTYNTHDEPRWYDMDSLVFISAITENDAMMGDDEKLIRDICDAALTLHPRFVAIAGTPIPMLIGTDFAAIAASVESRTGIPAMGFATNGMHSYVQGAGMAFDALARRFVREDLRAVPGGRRVNILGLTPLDFGLTGTAEAIAGMLEDAGFTVVSRWAMGDTLDNICRAGEANVNLVVSYAGFPAAGALQRRFGTPFVAGVPVGQAFGRCVVDALEQALRTGENRYPCSARVSGNAALAVIGESVNAGSLAAAITAEHGIPVRLICPLETDPTLLGPGDVRATDEDELTAAARDIPAIVADPLYRPVFRDKTFFDLPAYGFSGRIWKRGIPNLIGKPLR